MRVEIVPKGTQAELDAQRPDFTAVPVLIREHGRARGFERIRDLVLERPEAMGADSLLPVLKLVIELDRHAMFSAVSEAKAQERGDQDAWKKFQEYLHGDEATEGLTKTAKKEGKKRGKGKQKGGGRTEIREGEGLVGLLRGTDSAGPGLAGPEVGSSQSGQ